METKLLILTQPPCFISTPHRHRQPHPPKTSFPHHLSSPFRRSCTSVYYRRWDSNVETQVEEEEDEDEDEGSEFGFGGRWNKKKKKKRRWWSDDSSYSPETEEGPGGIFEEVIDSFWIFKVFTSYGWALPAIIASWLLATGPKAFLMALALPLGQSALSFAFDKLWGKTQSKTKRRSRMRRKPAASTASSVEMGAEEQGESQETRKGKVGYQSWIVGNDGSASNGGGDAPKFGGWDDLDRSRSAWRASRKTGGSRKTPTDNGKLSGKVRKSDTPLLLRLLIAVFPFLGSWTKILY
ncbi:uncharacterized protein LOC126688516 [Quercus robur]|uniref:uncharacterized protein LOC126688516 n=1 Tax=Quercus robur TaxID=38942 RepID=UPI0021612307|nr:uncharacterized protein LOC126688516 [Quercus robur]